MCFKKGALTAMAGKECLKTSWRPMTYFRLDAEVWKMVDNAGGKSKK